jgi:hypothetical protein
LIHSYVCRETETEKGIANHGGNDRRLAQGQVAMVQPVTYGSMLLCAGASRTTGLKVSDQVPTPPLGSLKRASVASLRLEWLYVKSKSAAICRDRLYPPRRFRFHPVFRLFPALSVGIVKPAPPPKLKRSSTCAEQKYGSRNVQTTSVGDSNTHTFTLFLGFSNYPADRQYVDEGRGDEFSSEVRARSLSHAQLHVCMHNQIEVPKW